MHSGWNLTFVCILTALCGQSLGFWPFHIFAASKSPEFSSSKTDIKRIAIIGMFDLIYPYYDILKVMRFFFF